MTSSINKNSERRAPWYYLLLLILAGESVFILPFVLARVFRPTVLEVFQLDNLQLGLCFSVYGVVALISYLLEGPIADKYEPRKLIAIALWMTALGGIVYASFPAYNALKILYGYWGFTTIFLFWAPMIKATRVWGGTTNQGKAFGFLDGGRGLVGALFGSLGVFIFRLYLLGDVSSASIAENQVAFRQVILTSSGLIVLVGILVWFFMTLGANEENSLDKISAKQIKDVLQLPSVWMLMIIILCAYIGYKITDIFSLYAQDVLLYDQVESAKVGTLLLYLRPIVGIAIGVLADRSNTTFWLVFGFFVSFLGALLFASGTLTASSNILFFLSILITSLGIYACRSLYFAIMEKGQIPLALTGTAVGVISIVGYTPDIFAGPIIGYLLESSPGEAGHQKVFWMLGIFSFIGGLTAFLYHFRYQTKNQII